MDPTRPSLGQGTTSIRFDDFKSKGQPTPSQPQQPGDPTEKPPTSEKPTRKPTRSSRPVRYRFLTPTEWAVFARGVGGLDLSDLECQAPVTPSSSMFFPTRGMPEGLYKDVVAHRNKFFLYFHLISVLRWVGMLLQLFISAALTGIGSMDFNNGMAITVMAASNTIIAGVLAMLHNSGLPDRYRYNQSEFDEVEDYLKMLLRTGVVEDSMTVDQVLIECFNAYHDARSTTSRNDPAFYLRGHRGSDSKFPGGAGDMPGSPGSPVPTIPAPPLPTPTPVQTNANDERAPGRPSK
ncbi:putative C6 transcription factor [Plectosphaerella plurivora]|uniref:C6 transcription factor n=1 Tax=Plectosphaerella plurivora TaxID=936078 RepID=A0A9P8VCD3_9PEZI|nr:putative C6 transcription factor [Plectosphaerella plurivora]